MHVVVVTVVHHPFDARIWHRQIAALIDAGHRVTYIAPFRGYGVEPPATVEAIDVARSAGRRRVRSLRDARRLVARHGRGADVVLLHDPELLLAVAFLRRPPTVWDVHEDTAADLADKAWLPAFVRAPARAAVRLAEHLAERNLGLLLAEDGYRPNFRHEHPVVPNEPIVPDDVPSAGDTRVVYVGRVSRSRGADALLALPGLLPRGVQLEVLGPADADVAGRFAEAARAGQLQWDGFVPNDVAQQRVEGALAGLSLLRDHANFRHSRPTKVVEYMARGVPVITTPTPVAAEIVEREHSGIVVPYDDIDAVAKAVQQLHDDATLRDECARRGHDAALARYDWRRSRDVFVSALEDAARRR